MELGVGLDFAPGLQRCGAFEAMRRGDRNGGADRNRTCDLIIANETLYQLSYDPIPLDGGFSVATEKGDAQQRRGSKL